jgi:hypothetical protein
MATAQIIGNVTRHPSQIVKAILVRPTILADESTDTVEVVVKTLVKNGHRAALLDVCEASGLDTARRAIIRAACSVTLH